MQKSTPWYETWFSSPFYALLYENRNEKEAANFVDKLVDFLRPSPGAFVLDAGCGTGRHAIRLAEKGFNVTGIDISEKNIQKASAFSRNNLKFIVHDMRNPVCHACFDFVFNFFTSFGYFETIKDNLQTLRAFHQSLKDAGILIIDFMHVERELKKLVPLEKQEKEGVRFTIQRYEKDNFIIKEIYIENKGKILHFKEQVQALRLSDFENYLRSTNFKIIHLFGNYHLNAFNPQQSERLIIIAKKY